MAREELDEFEFPALALLPRPKTQSLSVGWNGLPAKTAGKEAGRPTLPEISAESLRRARQNLKSTNTKSEKANSFKEIHRQRSLDKEEINVKKCQLEFKNSPKVSKQCPSSE